MTRGTVSRRMLRGPCDGTRSRLAKVTRRLNITSASGTVKVRVFRRVLGVPCSGFAKLRGKAMLMPSVTSAAVFTRVWVCVATIEPQCGATFEPLAKLIRSRCSTLVNVIGTVTGQG